MFSFLVVAACKRSEPTASDRVNQAHTLAAMLLGIATAASENVASK